MCTQIPIPCLSVLSLKHCLSLIKSNFYGTDIGTQNCKFETFLKSIGEGKYHIAGFKGMPQRFTFSKADISRFNTRLLRGKVKVPSFIEWHCTKKEYNGSGDVKLLVDPVIEPRHALISIDLSKITEKSSKVSTPVSVMVSPRYACFLDDLTLDAHTNALRAYRGLLAALIVLIVLFFVLLVISPDPVLSLVVLSTLPFVLVAAIFVRFYMVEHAME